MARIAIPSIARQRQAPAQPPQPEKSEAGYSIPYYLMILSIRGGVKSATYEIGEWVSCLRFIRETGEWVSCLRFIREIGEWVSSLRFIRPDLFASDLFGRLLPSRRPQFRCRQVTHHFVLLHLI